MRQLFGRGGDLGEAVEALVEGGHEGLRLGDQRVCGRRRRDTRGCAGRRRGMTGGQGGRRSHRSAGGQWRGDRRPSLPVRNKGCTHRVSPVRTRTCLQDVGQHERHTPPRTETACMGRCLVRRLVSGAGMVMEQADGARSAPARGRSPEQGQSGMGTHAERRIQAQREQACWMRVQASGT